MKLSIVATLYQSAPYIQEFYERICNVAAELVGDEYEIVLVNDGSPDNSLELALDLSASDSRVVLINLSRNFGHHKAIMTGLSYAKGDKVFLLDSDLEEEPEWLDIFAKKMEVDSCDVVFGVQNERKGGFFERLNGRIFYSVINYLAGSELPKNPTIARLMKKDYVKALTSYREHEVYIGGVMYLAGYDQQGCLVNKRHKGETVYTIRRKWAALVNSVTALSSRPLMLIFYFGLIVSVFSFLFVAKIVFQALFFDGAIDGWTSTIGSIWLVCGLLMSSVGVLGVYISKIFTEVKDRPYTIVKGIHRQSKKGNAMGKCKDEG
jgi:putative glycosyltransferase